MAITNTKDFGNHLDKDINNIFFDGYMDAPAEYTQIVSPEMAPMGDHYTGAELSPLGELREMAEGEGIEFDIPAEGHKKTVYYKIFGLGFQITKKMYRDDLFQNFKKMPAKLSKSARNKEETEFWDLFNSGFGTTQTAWDGLPIFSYNAAIGSTHSTLKSYEAINNEPSTAGSLSETTLQAAFEYYDTLIDEAGMPIVMRPNTLIVPTQLRYTAGKLMKNAGILGSANNDMNTMNPANGLVDAYRLHVGRFLTSSTAWFLVSNDHDLHFFWKQRPLMESADDFATGNALFKVTTEFLPFCMGYKGLYGNEGA